MGHWLEEYPALRVMQKSIAAQDYNRIRLGLLREQLPWLVPVPGFRCLRAIVEESAWICVDECQNGLPILAWTHFDTARSALDAPVSCLLRLYHVKAGLVMGSVLEALAEAAAEYRKTQSKSCPSVSALKR